MELLQELLEISNKSDISQLLEDLGNLGKLDLGPMVNAFKQTYSIYRGGRRSGSGKKTSSPEGSKLQSYELGKDSEAVDAGAIKNWAGVKKAYKAHEDRRPLAAIFSIDDKPAALLIAGPWDIQSINDKVALAWDFSKVKVTPEEAEELTKGLNKAGEDYWNKVVGSERSVGGSAKTEKVSKSDWDAQQQKNIDKFVTKKYSGFVQSVREVSPFINNLGTAFKGRLSVKLILADKVRAEKKSARRQNEPISKEKETLFTDDLRTRLAKYKNAKVDTVDDAKTFIDKVLAGGLKKLTFAGSTYSAVPTSKYLGSSHSRSYKDNQSFFDGTMNQLFTGKPVTMEFEADRKESDYNTLYLTVKLIKGALTPIEIKYQERDTHKTQTVKF